MEQREGLSSENTPDREKNILDLLDTVAVAAGQAVSAEDYEKRLKIATKAGQKLTSGKKLSEEEINILKQPACPNEVLLDDIETMQEVFSRIDVPQELITYFVEHEGAHLKTAKEEGFDPKIVLKFYKLKDGSIKIQPAVKMAVKHEEKDVGDGVRRVAEAPIEPSPQDREMTSKN